MHLLAARKARVLRCALREILGEEVDASPESVLQPHSHDKYAEDKRGLVLHHSHALVGRLGLQFSKYVLSQNLDEVKWACTRRHQLRHLCQAWARPRERRHLLLQQHREMRKT